MAYSKDAVMEASARSAIKCILRDIKKGILKVNDFIVSGNWIEVIQT